MRYSRTLAIRLIHARARAKAVQILKRDPTGRAVAFRVPGTARSYVVTLYRKDGRIWTYCKQESGPKCRGNGNSICYHSIAAVIAAAKDKGYRTSWCETWSKVKRLRNFGGRVVPVMSGTTVAYILVQRRNQQREEGR